MRDAAQAAACVHVYDLHAFGCMCVRPPYGAIASCTLYVMHSFSECMFKMCSPEKAHSSKLEGEAPASLGHSVAFQAAWRKKTWTTWDPEAVMAREAPEAM